MSKGSKHPKQGAGGKAKAGVEGARAGQTAAAAGLEPLISGPEAFAAAFNVSRETIQRLSVYADLLAKWQKTINLVAPSTLDQVWHRHFSDSAQLLERAPEQARVWVDLGSGGGFPGLVVAILLAGRVEHAGALAQPGRLILVESDSRKCAFLAEVVRKTGISGLITVEILNRRIEIAETQASVGSVDVISARALAPLQRLLQWAVPYMADHTVALFLKGRDAEAEIDEARARWTFECRSWPSVTDFSGKILEIQHVKAELKD